MNNPEPTVEYNFTAEDVAEHMQGLAASADRIASLIEANERSEEAVACMTQNVRHIGVMCAMDHLKDLDIQLFLDSASAGLAWLSDS